MSERTFFRHFSSKADLFLANWQSVADGLRSAMELQPYRAPLIEVVRAGLREFGEGVQRAVESDPESTMVDYADTLPVVPTLRIVIELESAVATELARRLDPSDEDRDIRIVANTSIAVHRACGRSYGLGQRETSLPALLSDQLDRLAHLFAALEEPPR